MSLVHEPSWGDGCLFGRSQEEDSRGRGGAAHEPERGRSRFRGESLLGQALREGGARRAFALAGEGSGQERPTLDEKARKLLEADVEERPFAKLKHRREYLHKAAGVSVSESTLSRAIRSMGFGRKKGRWVRVNATNS
jgi:transposase